MEEIMTDVSKKEEDQEVDIESYATGESAAVVVVEAPAPVVEAPADEEDELPVDVDKVYGDTP
jgi:hypothetical protein